MSSGPVEAGTLALDVELDTAGFARQLRTQIEAIQRNPRNRVKVPVEPTVTKTALRAALKTASEGLTAAVDVAPKITRAALRTALDTAATGLETTVGVRINVTEMRAAVNRAATGVAATVGVRLNIRDFRAELAAAAAAAGPITVNADVNVTSISAQVTAAIRAGVAAAGPITPRQRAAPGAAAGAAAGAAGAAGNVNRDAFTGNPLGVLPDLPGMALALPVVITGLQAAVPLVSGLAAGMVALGSTLGPVVASAAAGGPIIGALGLGIGSVMLSTQGVGEAFTLYSDAMGKAAAGEELTEAEAQKLKAALDALSPSARGFVQEMFGIAPAFNAMKVAGQEALFSTITPAVVGLAGTYLPLLEGAVARLSGTMGGVFARFAELQTSQAYVTDFGAQVDFSERAIGRFGTAGLAAMDIARNIFSAATPLADRFTFFLASAATGLAGMVQAGRDSGALESFFTRAGDTTAKWAGIIRDVGVALFNVFNSGTSEGQSLLDQISYLAYEFRMWTESIAGQNQLRQWFADSRPIIDGVFGILSDVFGILGRMGEAGDVPPLLQQIRDDFLPQVEALLNAVSGELGPRLIETATSIAQVLTQASAAEGAFSGFLFVIDSLVSSVSWILMNIPGADTALGALLVTMGLMKGAQAALAATGLAGPMNKAVTAIRAYIVANGGLIASSKTAYATLMLNVGAARMVASAYIASARAGLASMFASVRAAAVGAAASLNTAAASARAWAAAQLASARASLAAGMAAVRTAAVSAAVSLGTAATAAYGWVTAQIAAGVAATRSAAMTVASTVATVASRAAMIAGAAATWIMVAAQTALTAIMAINPFVLIIIAVVALVAALVYAWKNSETFRNIVTAAIEWVRDKGSAAVKVLGEAISAAWTWITDTTSAAWGWVKDFIGRTWDAIVSDWNTAVNVVQTVWDNFWKINRILVDLAWTWIKDFISSTWDSITTRWNNAVNAVQTAWDNFWKINRLLADLAWTWIKNFISTTWDAITTRFANAINAVQTAWSNFLTNLRTRASEIWGSIRSGIDGFLNGAQGAFDTAVNAIRTTWDRLRAATKDPVNFLINTVYNEGIRPVWNAVAGLVGVGQLPTVRGLSRGGTIGEEPQRFAFGGRVRDFRGGGTAPGYSPRRDSVPAVVSPGEGVLVPEATKGIGGSRAIDGINRAAMRGASALRTYLNAGSAPPARGYSQHFARGGITGDAMFVPGVGPLKHDVVGVEPVGDWLPDWVVSAGRAVGNAAGSIAERVKNFAVGGLKAAAGAALAPIRAGLNALGGAGFNGLVKAGGNTVIDKLLAKIGAEDEKASTAMLGGGSFGSVGGWPAAVAGRVSPNTAAAVNYIRANFGINNIGTLGSRPNKSDHPMGKALDAMIPGWSSPGGKALGNRIATYFVTNPNAFGTKYVIYYDQINTGSGWRRYTHPNGATGNPTLRHLDHVHVSFKDKGGVIPEMARGGTVLPSSGGTLALLGDGGRSETVVDEGLMNRRLTDMEALRRLLTSDRIGNGVTFHDGAIRITVHNPVGKTTDRSVNDSLRRVAELGAFG